MLNAVIAPWYLGEELPCMDLIATMLIVVGTVITTMFGSHETQDYTPATLSQSFQQREAVLFELLMWSFMLTIAVVQCHFMQSLGRRTGATLYALLAGAAGAQQFSYLKAVVDIIKYDLTTPGSGAFFQMQTYGFIACTVLFGVCQVTTLNKGLAKYDIVLFLPLYNSFLIIFGILCGCWIYGEFDSATMTTVQTLAFCAGGLVQCGGILLLTTRQDEEASLESPRPRSASGYEGVVASLGGTPVRSRRGSVSGSRRSSDASQDSLGPRGAGGAGRSGRVYESYGSLIDQSLAGELKITPAAHKQLTLAGLAVYSSEGELVVASEDDMGGEPKLAQTARLPSRVPVDTMPPESPSGGRRGSKSIDSGPVAPSVHDYLASSRAISKETP